MEKTISITQKWQIHVPKEMRAVFGKVSPGQIDIKTEDGKLVLTPHRGGIASMAGIAKKYAKGKNVDLDNIRDLIDYSQL